MDAWRWLTTCRQPARTLRLARALWIVWAIIVWNVTFDHVIVVAGREYIGRASTAASRSGPYARMDDWMGPAITRAFWIATAASVTIGVVGVVLIGAAVRLSAPASPSL
jgi:hypothetical protein